jgi:hypothetical protein
MNINKRVKQRFYVRILQEKGGFIMLEIGKCYVFNCFEFGELSKEIIQSEAIKGYNRSYNMVELENGLWLKSMNDGRYYKDGNEFSRWSEVIKVEGIDEDGNLDTGSVVGFVEI